MFMMITPVPREEHETAHNDDMPSGDAVPQGETTQLDEKRFIRDALEDDEVREALKCLHAQKEGDGRPA